MLCLFPVPLATHAEMGSSPVETAPAAHAGRRSRLGAWKYVFGSIMILSSVLIQTLIHLLLQGFWKAPYAGPFFASIARIGTVVMSTGMKNSAINLLVLQSQNGFNTPRKLYSAAQHSQLLSPDRAHGCHQASILMKRHQLATVHKVYKPSSDGGGIP